MNMNLELIMTKKIIVGNIDNSITEISNLMKKYDIGFLPIVDNNKVKGVITDRDIIIEALTNTNDLNKTIENYITTNIITADINKSIDDVLNIMGENKIKRIIINDNNKMVGIISLSDIINSKYNSDLIIKTLQKINEIKNNKDNYKTEIDEFYL